ncbi:MAG: hypothetical protein EOP42_34120, partial [Sphingobacteriaceae bacterium]
MNFKKLFRNFSFSAFLLLEFGFAYGQKIAVVTVNLSKKTAGIAVPLHLNLEEITAVSDSIKLIETTGSKSREIPFQIENKSKRVLYWLTDANASIGKHTYEFIKSPAHITDHIHLVKDSGAITIVAAHKNLLRYNYKTVYPPAGVDTVFKRSGFIHPLWSPKGQRLTRIGAPDHYHHFGLWDPWTHVYFEGDTLDFWNLNEKQGTVRFASFTSLTSGPIYADFQVLQQHIAFKRHEPEKGKEKIALNELQSVRIYQPETNSDYY